MAKNKQFKPALLSPLNLSEITHPFAAPLGYWPHAYALGVMAREKGNAVDELRVGVADPKGPQQTMAASVVRPERNRSVDAPALHCLHCLSRQELRELFAPDVPERRAFPETPVPHPALRDEQGHHPCNPR